jgi:hypothetical protein
MACNVPETETLSHEVGGAAKQPAKGSADRSRRSQSPLPSLGDVARYAACLILGKHLGQVSVIPILACIDIRERLTVGVTYFKSAGYCLDGPRGWEAAHW